MNVQSELDALTALTTSIKAKASENEKRIKSMVRQFHTKEIQAKKNGTGDLDRIGIHRENLNALMANALQLKLATRVLETTRDLIRTTDRASKGGEAAILLSGTNVDNVRICSRGNVVLGENIFTCPTYTEHETPAGTIQTTWSIKPPKENFLRLLDQLKAASIELISSHERKSIEAGKTALANALDEKEKCDTESFPVLADPPEDETSLKKGWRKHTKRIEMLETEFKGKEKQLEDATKFNKGYVNDVERLVRQLALRMKNERPRETVVYRDFLMEILQM
ncbi:hypothetical protein SBOR_9903 [Sclerotinia borealis F-4128]|uniref:Uncharacterized protein n=1 Tax=Sclerotinia borealis (strain F-4128) TaxID=1432307 RepID=W9C452_SCLBF|nr:hypothetical protein SBOR_9903 [Sclerotinia borealis F-4128]